MNIYEPQGRAREYSPLALNYFKGCDHGCIYCYVPTMFKRFNASYDHASVISPDDFSNIEKSAKKLQGINKQILLSFTSDPYCNVEFFETAKVLEILNRYGHKVAILTKDPTKALKDIEVIKSFGERIKIGSTLTLTDPYDHKLWEPDTPNYKSRVDGLAKFTDAGVKTWASFEPVMKPDQSLDLIKMVSDFIDHVKVGKLNNFRGYDKNIDWQKFIIDSVNLLRSLNMKFYVKNDLAVFNKVVEFTKEERDSDFLNL